MARPRPETRHPGSPKAPASALELWGEAGLSSPLWQVLIQHARRGPPVSTRKQMFPVGAMMLLCKGFPYLGMREKLQPVSG